MGVKVLAGIASAEDAPPAARVAAVTALFDRGWDKRFSPQLTMMAGNIRSSSGRSLMSGKQSRC